MLQWFPGGVAKKSFRLASNALKCASTREARSFPPNSRTTQRRQCWDTGASWLPESDATLDTFMDACLRANLKALPQLVFQTASVQSQHERKPASQQLRRYHFTSSLILDVANSQCAMISYISPIDSASTKLYTDCLRKTPDPLFTFTIGANPSSKLVSQLRFLLGLHFSYQISASSWSTILSTQGVASIRKTPFNVVALGLWVEQSHGHDLVSAVLRSVSL